MVSQSIQCSLQILQLRRALSNFILLIHLCKDIENIKQLMTKSLIG